MARTASTMMALGTSAPDFILPDVRTGTLVRRGDFAGKPMVVAFICNHCPYVKHIRSVFAQVAADYLGRGMAIVAISSNDAVAYPADGPQAMAQEAQDAGYRFPYLYDESQAVAKAYRAACTPDFFLFDAQHRLVYRGQFDGSRPKETAPVPVTGADLRAAMDAVLAGRQPIAEQKPSIGCNIKWKSGQEPDYAR